MLIKYQPKFRFSEDRSWGCRHTIACILFGGSVVCFMLRIALSVAMVAMVHNKPQLVLLQNENSFNLASSNYQVPAYTFLHVQNHRNLTQPICPNLVEKGTISPVQKG